MNFGRTFRRLVHSDGANVAPIVALSLFALVGAGGIAFDYARLAAMDTELQNAADQAALAAASQLDGEVGACARAAAAAASMLQNQTLFANDGDAAGVAVTVASESECDAIGSVRFYLSYNNAADTFGAAATTDAEANIVAVTVDGREAVYALTPIVGAFRSGSIAAEAVAGLGSAMCKVPPVMMCNPSEPDGNTDEAYDFTPNAGDGLRLVVDKPDAPGNFGFLRIDGAGAKEVAMQLGYDNPPIGCISSEGGVETQPGDMQAVRAAFNSRFDMSENGAKTCPAGGTCSPSSNTRKDLVRNAAVALDKSCGLGANNMSDHWHEALIPYRTLKPEPLSSTNPNNGDAAKPYPEVMGYPRDLCHATSVSGECTSDNGGIVGDGDWDRDAYFYVNYGWLPSVWQAKTLLGPDASRYDVYMWEIQNPSLVPATTVTQPVSGGFTASATPVCRSPGITPSPTTPDRRRISVAVVNCEAQNLNGHKTVAVRKWLDVFLVEPAFTRDDRTTNGDIYVEVIGVASSGGSTNNLPQRRDVPYLIR